MAVPFDPQRLKLTGAAVPVVEGVLQSATSGDAQYSFSATGSLVYVPGGRQSDSTQTGVGQIAMEQSSLGRPCARLRTPRLSPDGRRVAVRIEEQESQVWLYDLSRDTLTRLTFEGTRQHYPVWTPDGKRIAFNQTRKGRRTFSGNWPTAVAALERLTTSELHTHSGVLVPGWATAGLH